jgi:hypothetical protein
MVHHDPEEPVKYLCLIYTDEKQLAAMPKPEWDAWIDEHLVYDDAIRQSGHFIAAELLESIQAATTLRVRNGKMSVADGPFDETREQLGGFFLIEARDLNDAIQVASKIPAARLGSVEVRPIREFYRQYVNAARQ